MANTDAINSFLDQYDPNKPPEQGATPEPVTARPAIDQFLEKYDKQPEPQDVVSETAPATMTPEQAALMTHAETTAEPRFRPAVFTEAIKKGFADFAALPGYAVDLVNWPLNKLGITPDKPFGGSDDIRTGWELLMGYQDIQPQTRTERYARTVGEFAGGSMVPGMGITGKIATKGLMPKLTGNATKDAIKIREVWKVKGGPRAAQLPVMTQPATRSELAAVIGTEAASVVTGGTGSEFGGEIGNKVAGVPGEVIGRLGMGISAGMIPLYFKTAGSSIWNGLRAAQTITKDRASMMDNVAKAKIIQAIGENPEAPQNIEAAARLQKEIPGFNPNLAAAAGSKGLAQIQARLDMQSIDNYNTAVESIRKSQEAIGHYYDEVFPIANKKLSATRMFRQTMKGLKEQRTQLDQEIERVAAQYERKPTAEVGKRLRELRAQRKRVIGGDVEQAYNDLYQAADDLGIVDDVNDLYNLSTEFVRQDANAFQRMPSVYAKMRQIFGRDIDPDVALEEQKIMADFPKLHSLYREVSRQNGKALAAGDAQNSWYLGQIKELLDTKLAQFDDPIYGTFADHKRAVDSFYREEYFKVFRQGVGGKIPRETRWGQVTPDEKIVSDLVMQKGTARGINEFNKLYQNMPEAQTLLRDGILDIFASKVIRKGKIDQTEVRTFLNDYKDVFDQLPDMRNVFMNSDAITTALANRKAAVINKGRKFAQESISPYARIAGFESPKAAIQAGLKEPKIMRVLTRNAKTDAEKQDLTTLIADVVREQPDPWRYILENEDQLAKHFNQLKPGHFQKLKNIAEAEAIIARYHPKDVPFERVAEDPFYKRFGTTFASAMAQWRWALLYNKTSAYYPAADMGSKYLYKIKADKIDQLMERALYDPDLATTMSELSKVQPTQLGDLKVLELLNSLGLHAINNGIRASSVAIPEDEPGALDIERAQKMSNLIQ